MSRTARTKTAPKTKAKPKPAPDPTADWPTVRLHPEVLEKLNGALGELAEAKLAPKPKPPTRPSRFDHTYCESRAHALAECRRAVRRYRDATHWARWVDAVVDAAPGNRGDVATPDTRAWESWRDAAQIAEAEAVEHLCRVILLAMNLCPYHRPGGLPDDATPAFFEIDQQWFYIDADDTGDLSVLEVSDRNNESCQYGAGELATLDFPVTWAGGEPHPDSVPPRLNLGEPD